MELTGVNDEMLEKAREATLLGRLTHSREVPLEAIGVITKRLWQEGCVEWKLDELEVQASWDRLPPGLKQLELQRGAGLVAVLGLAGFKIVPI